MRTVLHQIDLEAPVPGGIDTCIVDLAKHSPKQFQIVGVDTSRDRRHRLGVWRDVDGVRFMAVARLRRDRTRRLVPHSLLLALGVLRFRRRIKPLVVQAHRPEVGLVSRVVFRRPLVQFLHGDGKSGVSRQSDSYFRFAPRLFYWVERKACSSAAQVVIFSEIGFKRLQASGFANVRCSPTWFDASVFAPQIERPSRDRVLWVGRFEQPKDPLLAVEVFAAMVDSLRQDSELTMVGDGSLLPAARRHAESLGLGGSVSFVGAVPRSEVARLMREHSVTVVTSHFEGMSRSILESMACGTPVASTASGDPGNSIVDGTSGFRVNSRSPSEIAVAALRAARIDRETCWRAASKYSSEVVIAELLA